VERRTLNRRGRELVAGQSEPDCSNNGHHRSVNIRNLTLRHDGWWKTDGERGEEKEQQGTLGRQ
jgi:hypothetical protein